MADQSWRQLEDEPWQRLVWARSRKFPTAQAAAESLGIRANTYTAYERPPNKSKHTTLGHQQAMRFGEKYGVRWEWLLTGDGSPFREDSDPGDEDPTGRVVRLIRGVPRDQQERIVSAIEALVKTDKGG